MPALKGALIGFGQVAEKAHLPAWKARSDFELTAVVDEREERLKEASRYLPKIRTYQSIEELFQKEKNVDFVDIATPPMFHTRQTSISLQRGCHVLSEKPLCLKPQNFESIRALCLYQNRVVFDTHNWKYAPLFLKASDLVRGGALGAVRYLELHTLRQGPATDAGSGHWRMDPRLSGGGILVDHGWHNFYLVQMLLGKTPLAISAQMTIPHPHGVEEEAHCLIQYPGATAAVHLSWRAGARRNWGVLYGSDGILELRDDHIRLEKKDGSSEIFRFGEKLSQSSAHPRWFETMLSDFKTEIENPDLRYQNLRETEICLTLLTHAYESHRFGGKSITLPAPAHDALGRTARHSRPGAPRFKEMRELALPSASSAARI